MPLRAVATAGDAVAAPCLDHDAASGFTRPVVIDIDASCIAVGAAGLAIGATVVDVGAAWITIGAALIFIAATLDAHDRETSHRGAA